jgi:hypothetical protein
MKKFIKLAPALFMLALILSTAFGAYGIPLAIGLSFIPSGSTGVAYDGLNKEVWIEELLEGFYSEDNFLTECRDLSSFVENDVINLAEAGVTPEVLINNTTYPIPIVDMTETPLALEIDRFDTENVPIMNADKVEKSYDKLSSVVYNLKETLREKIMIKALHAIAPGTNGTFTPKITSTGLDNGSGRKALTWKDVRKLQRLFTNAKIPTKGRIIIFTEQHLADLETEDLDRFNKVIDKGEVCGFKIYSTADSNLPRYHVGTGDKVAFGATDLSTDGYATIAFHKSEVGRAMGTTDMFHSKAENDPIYRRDVVGFAQRAMVLPIRNKGIAAIYSPAV